MRRADGSISSNIFDFDDDSMHLDTPILVRHKISGEEREVRTGDFAKIRGTIGQAGPWSDVELKDWSYRRFRDEPFGDG